MNKYLLSLIMVFPLVSVIAQDTDDEAEVEEIVTTGIKSSLKDAIDIKRNNVGVMEAITAEDFGKFPDGNLAESLARVAGVGIDRSNVEGEGVAVRGFGPELNLVTLNGRQMPTVPGQYGGGRSFNFGDIASPGISAVELYKSTNNSLPSGGIGSTINMVTTKPLNIEGTKMALSVGAVNDTTSVDDNLTPEVAMLFATNRDQWGFSFSGSYQDRTNREEGTRESNWLIPSRMALIEGYNRLATQQNVVDNNTRTDGVTFYQEPTAYQIKDNDRLRKNAQVTFQWAFSDDVITTLDYTYSGVDFSSVGTMFGSWLGGWDTVGGTINSNGVYTDVQVANRSYDHQLIWGDTKSANRSIGFNTEYVISDSLALTFDAHHSTALKNGTELPNEMGMSTDGQATITHLNGGSSGINSFSYDRDYNSGDMFISSLMSRDAYKKNNLNQYQIKGEWINLDNGIVKSVDFGISKTSNKFYDARSENTSAIQGPTSLAFDDDLFVKTDISGFMDAFDTALGTNYYFNVNKDAAVAAFVNAGGAVGSGDIDTNERVNEDMESAFVQFNMETELYGRPLNIIAGVRYEASDTVSTSLEAKPSFIRVDFINGVQYVNEGGVVDAPRTGSTEDVLPSLAMSYALSDNEVLRFSASKTIARPSLQDKRSGLAYGNADFWNPTATGGNPNLESLKSNNYDLAYENYYADGSYVAANFFLKEITDFISSSTTSGVALDGLTNAAYGENILQARQCMQDWVDAGRPGTAAGDPSGVVYCVSQQALWAQPWMNDNQHAMWVALAKAAHGGELPEFWNVYWAQDAGMSSPNCNDGGWWRCNPGYIDSTSSDPLALFSVTRPMNLEEGDVSGVEITLQHLFEGTPYGMQFNATKVTGGDVDIDRDDVDSQFILPGFGDAGNLSFFYEDDKHTFRIAANYRGETVAGFGNYEQPLYVEARTQIDATYQYRVNENTTVFLDMMNINDETTRLHARYSEMLFLAQDHGPIYKLGFRANF